MSDFEALIKRVREHGCRITQQRRAILQALYALDGHASAERIHERVIEYQPGVDLSTVYRTLERLRDLRVLSETDLGRGCAEYEIVTDQPHHHLVCQHCGRVIEVDHRCLDSTADMIRQEFDFEPILDHLAIFGVCEDCHSVAPGEMVRDGRASREKMRSHGGPG